MKNNLYKALASVLGSLFKKSAIDYRPPNHNWDYNERPHNNRKRTKGRK